MGFTEKQMMEEARRLRYRHQIGFAVYSGGLETGHLSALYNLMEASLQKHATTPYCVNVAEYIIGVYTDGNICQYGYVGVSKVRLLAKDRSISCCMGVPEALRRGKTSEELKIPFADLWLDCFEAFAKRIEKAKYEFNRELYFSHISRAVDEFLLTDDVPMSTPGDRAMRVALQNMVDNSRLRGALGERPPRISEEILEYLATPDA